jgi:hypothetical protein
MLNTFLSQLFLVPVTVVLKTPNLESEVNCSTNCAISAGQILNTCFFTHFSPGTTGSWIQTVEVMTSCQLVNQLCHHCWPYMDTRSSSACSS